MTISISRTPTEAEERTAADAPFGPDTGYRTLDLADANDADLDLAPGAYEVFNAGSFAWLRLGAATVVPESGGGELAGQFPVPAGASVVFVWDGSGDARVHARLKSEPNAAETLNFMRKAVR